MTSLTVSETGNAPGYHQNLLITRFRPEAVAGVAALGEAGEPPGSMPGLTALQQFEQQGLVQQVTPIGRPAEDQAGPDATALTGAIMNSRPAPANGDPTAGVNLIRLDPAGDVDRLRAALDADPTVEYAERVPVRFLAPVNARDEAAAPTPRWNLDRIQWEDARAIPGFRDDGDIRVAILDTGVQADHPDLDGRVAGYTYEHLHLPAPTSPYDVSGHGTHVAGILGAVADNDFGIDGLSNAQLLIWKIFNDAEYQYVLTDAQRNEWFAPLVDPVLYYSALAACIRENVDVVNLSVGGPMPPNPVEQQLFDRLLGQGATVVAAMGNARQNGSPITYPAAIDGVLAVGATDAEDTVAPFSNGGEHIALCAPGVGIWSTVPTYPGQGYITLDNGSRTLRRQTRKVEFAPWDGTSMATPHVTAAVALLLANRGRMNGTAVRELLTKTADPVPGMNGDTWHPDYGAGRLNLLRLLSTPD